MLRICALVCTLTVAGTSATALGAADTHDVSNTLCWVGEWTQERCCRGDSTTVEECWRDSFDFGDCCPNADCWAVEGFTYERCCDASFGEQGNSVCWSGSFTYEHCCLANRTARSWVDVFVGDLDMDQIYGMDEFYTDAQYGEDFGYYSTGRVLLSEQTTKDAQQFAHFTTYPMALSPHYGRVMCRLLLLMWIHLEERTPFRVVEMGAGSGQLAIDILECVRSNALAIAPDVWQRWLAAFEYLIIERSPALAAYQRSRGLNVVAGDAQTVDTCRPALEAFPSSVGLGRFSGTSNDSAGEAGAGMAGGGVGASVVLSNELLDAFAPVKLRLSVFGQPDVADCQSWQEMRILHLIPEADLRSIVAALSHSESRIEALVVDLQDYTSDFACHIANTSVGRAAWENVPAASCLALTLGVAELMNHPDLQLPSASHNMRLRLRKDPDLADRLTAIVGQLEETLQDLLLLPKFVYQQLRHQLRSAPDVEVTFLAKVHTRQVPVPLSSKRCEEMSWWMHAHQARVSRLMSFYGGFGYPAVQFLVRPGEQRFVELVDCLTGPAGGYMLSVDYGASFEALGHSLSVDHASDGIFIPPVPQELLTDLPDCYASWPMCAGRVDWTTFVDFTNLASAGESLGWRSLFYGPQSMLEHMSRRNFTTPDGRFYSVPGYSVLENSAWASRTVQNWYGRELLASQDASAAWQQRWTSFKAVLLEKPAVPTSPRPAVIVFPPWHLDADDMDSCWRFDPSALPMADFVLQQQRAAILGWGRPVGDGDESEGAAGQSTTDAGMPWPWPPRATTDLRIALSGLTDEISGNLSRHYSEAYEEAQLAVRMIDWLVATEGCDSLRPAQVATTLNSYGLWQSLMRRLLRAWEDVWEDEVVERVALTVLKRLAHRPSFHSSEPATPTECMAQQTFIALCEFPGDASPAKVGTFPTA